MIEEIDKPVLTSEEINLQIQMIEKDIAEISQKLFQAQGALMLMHDLADRYQWKNKEALSSQ